MHPVSHVEEKGSWRRAGGGGAVEGHGERGVMRAEGVDGISA